MSSSSSETLHDQRGGNFNARYLSPSPLSVNGRGRSSSPEGSPPPLPAKLGPSNKRVNANQDGDSGVNSDSDRRSGSPGSEGDDTASSVVSSNDDSLDNTVDEQVENVGHVLDGLHFPPPPPRFGDYANVRALERSEAGPTEEDTFAGVRALSPLADTLPPSSPTGLTIRSKRGTVRGVRNRVRQGIATFLRDPSKKVRQIFLWPHSPFQLAFKSLLFSLSPEAFLSRILIRAFAFYYWRRDDLPRPPFLVCHLA